MKRTIRQILKALTFPYSPELSVLLVSDRKIKGLNLRYRRIKKVTDVLSFSSREDVSQNLHPEVLGDIVISLPCVQRQAREGGITIYEELNNILIHSILHLCGYSHESVYRLRRMRLKEKEIASSLRSSQ
jgi:probable rRNA maturation factor